MNCPSCHNKISIKGEDRCPECLHSLMQVDLPHSVSEGEYTKSWMKAPVTALITGKDLLVADPEDSVEKAVHILRKEKKDCVLVYENKKLVGIVSCRDLLHKVAGKCEDLTKVKIQDVMKKNPEFVNAEDFLADIINKMAMGGFRHVPVLTSEGTPISIISIKDVMMFLRSSKNI